MKYAFIDAQRSGHAVRTLCRAPRVRAELSALGVACSRNTVAKLMRREQIVRSDRAST